MKIKLLLICTILSYGTVFSQAQVKTKPELEQIRKEKLAQQIQILNSEKDLDKKQRALQALQFVAHEESIEAIKPFLRDQQLHDPAIRTLLAIYPYAKEGVATVFLSELKENNSKNVQLIQALIAKNHSAVVPILEKVFPQKESRVNQLILAGLAHFAQPSSKNILWKAAQEGDFQFEPTQAFESYVLYLKNTKSVTDLIALIKKPNTNAANKALIASTLVQISPNHLMVAWEQFATLDKSSSHAIIEKLVRVAGVKDWSIFTGKFNSLSNTKQIELLDEIALLEPKSSSIFLQGIQSKNSHVRTSLSVALLRVDKEKAYSKVWDLLKEGNLDGLAVGQSLKTINVSSMLQNELQRFEKLSFEQQKAMMIYGASRKWQAIEPYMWRAIQSNGVTRKAGFVALVDLGKVQDFDLVAGKLGQTDEELEVKSVQASLTNMLKSNPELSLKLHGYASKAIFAQNYINFLNEAESLSLAYQIAKKSKSEEAIRAYVRINSKLLNTTQQILNYRNALALTNNPLIREEIYKRLFKCPSISSLRVLKDGLREMANKSSIADGMVQMFVSNSDLQSQMTKEWMQEVMPFVPSQELKEQLNKEFAKTAGKTGFYTLFNGRDLTGWKGLVENPIKRKNMHPDTLAKKQIKADELMRKGWYAKEGELHFTGHGDNLCTIKDYQDFEMYVDWKIEKDGDAGIYLRGSPQVQIWDIARVNVGANVGSGGLYNNQKNPSKPLKLVDNPIEEWNTFKIIMKGERVSVYLNGEMVVDQVILENYWDRNLPIFVKEAIELQAHGNHIVYRDIYVKELEPEEIFKVSKEEQEEGFESLFDGQSLFKWTGNTIDYVPSNGDLVIYPTRGGKGNIYTKKEYDNFHMKFEFKLTPGANNGLGIRAPLEGDAAYVGMELQILDNTAKIYDKLQPYQYHGSVYGIIPAKREYLKPVGEWNMEEVIAQGNHIQVILNGEIIVDGDLAEATMNGTADHKEHPGLFNKTGHIGFLGHGSEVRFRYLRIKELGPGPWKKSKKK